jgi:hypothetical protein
MRRMLVLVGGLAVLVGCGPRLMWQHQSFGTPPTQAEIDECRRDAYLEAQQQAFFYDFARPGFFVDRAGRLRPAPFTRFRPHDPFFLEQDLFRFCMRARGYRLVPAPPAEGAADGPTAAPPD